MRNLFERSEEPAVSFCERWGAVYTASCRQDAILARARERALVWAGRIA